MKKEMDLLKTVMIIALFILSSSFSISEIVGKKSDNNQCYTIQQYIEEEIFLEWGYQKALKSPFIDEGGIVFVNMTLLQSSNSNVSLFFVDYEGVTWSPVPPDYFILSQGENYSQTFTLLQSGRDNSGSIFYQCMVLQENATATILWGYNVISTGTHNITIGIETIVIGLMTSFIGITIWRIKTKKKN
ncbi:MAG: hypothetical protein ACFFDW_01210 [Candidatus Thorarchaeota archaeon]